MKTGIQQFMLGSVMNTQAQARETLAAVKAAGYDGIELCAFMIHPTGLLVRLLTRAAGMPTGSGGKLDWHSLVKEAGLEVLSLPPTSAASSATPPPSRPKRRALARSTPSSPVCTALPTPTRPPGTTWPNG